MIKILVVTHAGLGKSLVESAKMLGVDTTDINYITFDEQMGVELLQKKIVKIIDSQSAYLIFTDILGGSPFNVSTIVTRERNQVKIFYGINLPIFIEAVSQKGRMSLKELVNHLTKIKNDSLGFSNL